MSLDLDEGGFVVRCEIRGGRGLRPGGPVSLDLRDTVYTRYERVDYGDDFIACAPAIPAEVEWLKVYTQPETHSDVAPQ